MLTINATSLVPFYCLRNIVFFGHELDKLEIIINTLHYLGIHPLAAGDAREEIHTSDKGRDDITRA